MQKRSWSKIQAREYAQQLALLPLCFALRCELTEKREATSQWLLLKSQSQAKITGVVVFCPPAGKQLNCQMATQLFPNKDALKTHQLIFNHQYISKSKHQTCNLSGCQLPPCVGGTATYQHIQAYLRCSCFAQCARRGPEGA